MDIDPIKQGPGYACAVALDLLGRAPAFMKRISKITARTWIHRNFFTKPKIKIIVKRPRLLPDGYPVRPKTIGEKIKKKRLDKGLYQKDVAKIIGVDVNTITLWENDRCRPYRESCRKLRSFWKCPLIL